MDVVQKPMTPEALQGRSVCCRQATIGIPAWVSLNGAGANSRNPRFVGQLTRAKRALLRHEFDEAVFFLSGFPGPENLRRAPIFP